MKHKMLLFFLLVMIAFFSVGGSYISQMMLAKSYLPYKGVCIVIDAGHGGKDQGAQYAGVYESEINLEISLKLKEELENLGMDVILTRSDENDLSDENAQNHKREDLKKRMEIINEDKVDLYISIHMNSFVDSSVNGSQIFYKKGNADAKLFAQTLNDSIASFTKTDMKVKTGNYYILNESEKIGILLECGFLSNDTDRNNLINPAYQNKLVTYLRKGIVSFIKDIYE